MHSSSWCFSAEGRINFENRDGIQDYAGFLDVAIPQREELCQLVGLRCRQVVDLARVDGEVVELPGARAVRRGQVKRLPVGPADGAAAEQLPAGAGNGVMYRRDVARQIPDQRAAARGYHLAAAVGGAGMRGAGEFQHSRGDVHDGRERCADLTLPGEARPGDEPDNPDPAFGGERLVQARRRGGSLCPARAVPDERGGATKVVEAVV